MEVRIDRCDQAKRKRRAHRKEQCFDSLTRNYGERAVQVYKKALGVGSCEPNADLSNKGIPRTVTKAAAKNAMIEAAVAGYETSASAAVLEEPVSDPADAAEPAPPDSEVVDYGEPVYCGSGGC